MYDATVHHYFMLLLFSYINVKGNQKWTIQRNWQQDTRRTIQRNWQQDTRRRQTKQIHNTICVEHHYAQTNTYNVNET